LAAVETWSQSLKTTLNILLTSGHPMLLFWGEDLIQFYNDAFRPSLGADRHPQGLGCKAKEFWLHAWHIVGKQIETVMTQGEFVWNEDYLVPIVRNGNLEEVYWTYSYSPVRDDSGNIKGVLVVCTETTKRVISERQLKTQRELATQVIGVKSVEQACEVSAGTLANNPDDVPFALLYVLDENQTSAQLTGITGLDAGTPISPQQIKINSNSEICCKWALSAAIATNQSQIVELPFDKSTDANTAIVLPLIAPGQSQVNGFLIAGISPKQSFNDDYQSFFDLISIQIGTAINNANAWETERRLSQIRENARRETQALETRMQSILSSIRDGFVILDYEWRFTYLNDRQVEIFGMQREDILGQNIWELFPHVIGTEIELQLRQAMLEKISKQFEYFSPNGNRWFEIKAYPTSGGIAAITAEITERKQADEKIRESERKLRRLVESNMFGVIFGDSFGQINYANKYLLNIIGYTSEEMESGKLRWDTLTPPEYAASDAKAIQELCIKGVCTSYEKEYFHKDGRRIPILIGAAFLDEPFDENQEVIAFVLDLSQLKRITEERDNFFNLSLEMMVIANLNGYFIKANAACEQILGWTPTEMTTRPYLELLHPDDVAPTAAEAQKLAEGIDTISFENRYLHKDGSYRWISWTASTFPERQVIYCVGRDVTERKQNEIKLQQFAALIDNSIDFIGLATPEGKGVYVNPAGCRLMGLENLEAALETEILDYFFPEDKAYVREVILPTQVREGFWHGEFRFRHFQTGEAIPVDYSAFAIRDSENNEIVGFATVTRDIRERVAIEAERERILQREQVARETAEQANRIKDEFLAVLSHELRTPLNPILGWSKILQQGKVDENKTKLALETIERNAKLQTQLIDDLLDISKILRGKLSLDEAPVNLATVIKAALETVRLAAEAKSIHIHTAKPLSIGTVNGDAGRLQQVIWNLLSNAIKFTPHNGHIWITLTQVENRAQIQIKDSGKGINKEFLPYLFEHFRQEDSATNRKFGGLGLGLAIVRQLVELHGGSVKADSPGAGQGATFTVEIPTSSAVNSTELTPEVNQLPSNLNGINILVVDDEVDSLELIAFILQREGAIITSATSASIALEIISNSTPDLIISDIGMPEMDGYELIKRIRASEKSKSIPAIAVTAYTGEVNQQQAIAAGFQQHISKPIDANKVVDIVMELVKGY
ncbi:MAG: PAS domain S-box protein, partial [Cyanobacteria bacterium P01_H01_bin.150]